MKFNFSIFKKKEEVSTVFGLYVTDLQIKGFIYDAKNLSSSPDQSVTMPLSSGLEKIAEDVDSMLATLEQNLKEPLKDTVFFLHSFMVDNESFEIKTPYKEVFKKLSKDLQLKPIGFVNVSEGLSLFFQNKQIKDVISVEVNNTKIGISIIKNDKVTFHKYIAKTDDVASDLQGILLEMPRQTSIPNNIYLYGIENLNILQRELLNFQFADEIFTSEPNIEIVDNTKLINLLINLCSDENTNVELPATQSNTAETASKTEFNEEVKNINIQETNVMGFLIGADIETALNERILSEPKKSQQTSLQEKMPVDDKNFLNNFLTMFKNLSLNKKPVVYGVIFAVVFFAIGLVYEYFFHSIELKVMLKTVSDTNEFEFMLPVSLKDDQRSAALKKVTEQEFKEEIATSGIRETGEKATGELILYNYGKDKITLKDNTEMTNGSLVFLIDSEITINGRSESGERGVAKVGATAQKIGPEYNLPKGTSFSQKTFSQDVLEVVAEKPFTGGVKKEVKTVSRDDISTIRKKITAKINSSSEDILGANTDSNLIVLKDSISSKTKKETLSAEIGEESKKISGTIKSEISYVALQKNLFKEEIYKKIKESLSSEYEINKNDLEFDIIDSKINDEDLNIEAKINYKYFKDISLSDIAKNSVFKSPAELEKYLENKFEVASVSLASKNSHNLWTPIFQKNIKVELDSQ